MADHPTHDPGAAVAAQPPRRRRTQDERTQETRLKAVEATIALLASVGYAATTTAVVAKRAGISRGGMLHHFPTKIDLIEAVVRDVENRLRIKRRNEVTQVEEPVQRFVRLTDATWASFQTDEIVALTEILLAMRGDAALEARLLSVVEEMDRRNLAGTLEASRLAGLDNVRLIEAMHHLHYAAMRGLVLEGTVVGDRSKMRDAFDLLVWYKQILTAAARGEETDRPPLPF